MKLCIFSHRLRVERAEPFPEGLALDVELDGRRPQHTVLSPVCGDRMGSVSGDCMGSVSGDRVGRLICYTETMSTR